MAVPMEIRSLGPWKMRASGDFARLKSGYRLAITREGFVVVRTQPHEFAAEYSGDPAVVISLAERRRQAEYREA